MEKKLKITNGKQFQTLISELEKNPTLAKGFHRGTTPNNFKNDWEKITAKLNSIGPPMRDSDGWQKVWRDFKFKVKKKLVQKNEENKNDNGKIKQVKLLPLEEAAANLMQFKKQLNTETVDSDMSTDIKIKTENTSEFEHTFMDEDMQHTVANEFYDQESITPSRKKRKTRKNDEQQELLEKVFSNISYTMIDIRNFLNDWSRHQQKIWEIKEKRLKMIKRQHEREEQLFEADMKLKNIELKMITKKLEFLEKQSKR